MARWSSRSVRDLEEERGQRFSTSLDGARRLDAEDELTGLREHFSCPPGTIYLMGNSLGLPSIEARQGALPWFELAGRLAMVAPEIPVVFMSGYTDDVIAHTGVLEAGMKFVQKPFSARSLLTKIDEALTISRAYRRSSAPPSQ